MATVEPQLAPVTAPTRPQSAQPGGGFCLQIELAWGRLRRAWLRRFRPGYVARMAEKRQGDCPSCPHDIIDPRDLKFFRNVCGYWFHSVDDLFAWRGRLGLARMALAEVVCFSLLFATLSGLVVLGGALVHQTVWLALPILFYFWFEAVYFFRDPHRDIPTDPNALVSPADGTITHIGEVDDTDFPGGRAFRIGIFLSVFNVHVNRSPRAGRVIDVRYYPGAFLDARREECAVCNEQLWTDFDDDGGQGLVRVKQIAGALARRIVCWLRPGETVKAGDRFGMIKYGSRTEVLVSIRDTMNLRVQVGDRVKGGATVLLQYRNDGTE
jgi:phosphatidylserine decarboxylase